MLSQGAATKRVDPRGVIPVSFALVCGLVSSSGSVASCRVMSMGSLLSTAAEVPSFTLSDGPDMQRWSFDIRTMDVTLEQWEQVGLLSVQLVTTRSPSHCISICALYPPPPPHFHATPLSAVLQCSPHAVRYYYYYCPGLLRSSSPRSPLIPLHPSHSTHPTPLIPLHSSHI